VILQLVRQKLSLQRHIFPRPQKIFFPAHSAAQGFSVIFQTVDSGFDLY